jgi:hypothetical protein
MKWCLLMAAAFVAAAVLVGRVDAAQPRCIDGVCQVPLTGEPQSCLTKVTVEHAAIERDGVIFDGDGRLFDGRLRERIRNARPLRRLIGAACRGSSRPFVI